MTFVQLYGAQLDIELSSADRTQLFTTARRKQAVNDAMHNFERTTSCTPVYGNIPIVDNTAEYDLMAAFPNFISLHERQEPFIKRVSGSTITYIQGESFVRRTPHWLDEDSPGWRADSKGTPSSWYIRNDTGKTYIGVDPPPAPGSETWTLTVPYLSRSTDMSADSDLPFTVGGNTYTILTPYHQGLVHYAAGLLEPLRKAYSLATRQMQYYAQYVADYEKAKRKGGPNQVTMRRNYYGKRRNSDGTPSRGVGGFGGGFG